MNKILNIKPEDCLFFVDEQNKCVTCRLNNTQHLFIDFIDKNSRLRLFDVIYVKTNDQHNLFHKMLMPNSFVGVAKCSPDDTWDENIGRLVAFSKVKDKVSKSFFKRANTYFHIIDKWLDETEELLVKIGVKLSNNQRHRHEYITQLVGEKNT